MEEGEEEKKAGPNGATEAGPSGTTEASPSGVTTVGPSGATGPAPDAGQDYKMVEAVPVDASEANRPVTVEGSSTVTPPDVETLMRTSGLMAVLQRMIAEEAAKTQAREAKRAEAVEPNRATAPSVSK